MKRIIGGFTMALAVLLLGTGGLFSFANALNSGPFKDIDKSYAKHEIIELYNNNILLGTSETSFSPERSITRAEFITVLSRLLGLEQVISPVPSFADVPRSAWYYGWVQTAVQLGLSQGTSASTFAPQNELTRQEAAVWIARAFKQTAKTAPSSVSFVDQHRIADWADQSVVILHQLKLLQGDPSGSFRPADPITREETAVLLGRLLNQESWVSALKTTPAEKIVMGWQYAQSTEEYKKSVLSSNVNTLSPRWYFLDKTGLMSDATQTELISWAKANGKQVWPLVGNRFDQETTHQVLSDDKKRSALINQLESWVDKYDLDGLNIDFENMHGADRQYFTSFIAELAVKMRAQGAVLSVDVSPDLGTDWTEVLDYAELGKHADYMVMMAYDEHYDGSMYPGSTASLLYVNNAIDKLLETVPASKTILALPLYIRDWELKADGKSRAVKHLSLPAQTQLMNQTGMKPLWDVKIAQYVSDYSQGSVKHKVWFEEGRSLTAKYNVALERNLAGVAYWHIGGESQDIWVSFRNAERFHSYKFS